jgi:hypothetical protein
MKMLSVDWDYFYPSSEWYDWGAYEENPIFFEFIWNTRASAVHTDGTSVIDHMKPTGHLEFWDKVLTGPPIILCIAESHKDALEIMGQFRGVEVHNYDAHHDLGYRKNPKYDCGSWAYHGLKRKVFSKYKLIYPEWRKHEDEAKPAWTKKFEITKEITPDEYDIVFICRSGCWTPAWYDHEWLKFVEYFKKYPILWRDKKFCEFALKERMTLQSAIKIGQEYKAMLSKTMSKLEGVSA